MTPIGNTHLLVNYNLVEYKLVNYAKQNNVCQDKFFNDIRQINEDQYHTKGYWSLRQQYDKVKSVVNSVSFDKSIY